ncbi:hypothetical protein DAETH_00950 [Deinococcus aetherius]|uniref:Uncharacterized protein n=1 Tax=Deinococcus aetherius TaxID=200252 RepID=A0ABM8A8R5_9DEIO|nr:hypothetical protein [Deinococcus aetherius]BDP40126.1 hypothetical protein DAETH_00950 [Deinococcus aetherius]
MIENNMLKGPKEGKTFLINTNTDVMKTVFIRNTKVKNGIPLFENSHKKYVNPGSKVPKPIITSSRRVYARVYIQL